MKKIITICILALGLIGFNGCGSSDTVTPEERIELLSELYPEIFDAIKGDDGDSAYQVAVNNGFEGTVEEWLQSLVGADGENGICETCVEDNITIDPIECFDPFELEEDDTDMHVIMFHQRKDINDYTFYSMVIENGYPINVSYDDPTDTLPFMLQEDDNKTFLYGIYPREDSITEDAAIGIQFSQTAPEPIPEPIEPIVVPEV